MKPSVLYRAAAVLLLLFAVGHTLGFTQSDPKWGVDGVLAAMRSQRFDIGGFERSWWDFYLAAGLTAALFYVFAACRRKPLHNCVRPPGPSPSPSRASRP
jgi:hypothetical protein